MRGKGKLLGGLLLGAGAMYLDPDRGVRRRALLRDKAIHESHKLREGLGATARDLKNRSVGAATELTHRWRKEQAGDEIIQERVRSALGRAVSHPGSIDVAVHEGRVILSGSVLSGEVDQLIAAVRGTRGVKGVENQLRV